MRRFSILVALLSSLLVGTALAQDPVPIIWDTDMGYDCDDAGALAVLHALADKGEVDLLAVMSVVGAKYTPGAIDAINTYYGRPDIPIGQTVKPIWLDADDKFDKYIALNYPNDLTPRGKKKVEVPSAVSLYRKILASQPDHSVVIVATGFLRNLADLLNSSPDEYSALDGTELVAKKVHKLVVMGGEYPSGREFNFYGGPLNDWSAAQRVVEDWPTPIMFSGFDIGYPIMTGSRLFEETPESNPVRKAYALYPGTTEEGDRHSWDQTAILYAARGLSDYWTAQTIGHVVVKNDGSNIWKLQPDSRRSYLVQKLPVSKMEKIIGDLMVKPPERQQSSTSEANLGSK